MTRRTSSAQTRDDEHVNREREEAQMMIACGFDVHRAQITLICVIMRRAGVTAGSSLGSEGVLDRPAQIQPLTVLVGMLEVRVGERRVRKVGQAPSGDRIALHLGLDGATEAARPLELPMVGSQRRDKV